MKKNNIIRKIKYNFNSDTQAILVNKTYYIGIIKESLEAIIFIYYILNNKFIKYSAKLKNDFSKKTYKIIKIDNNYFLIWNNYYYYLFQASFN